MLGAGAATAVLGSADWLAASDAPAAGRTVERLDTGWRFLRQDATGAERADFDDRLWEPVSLPHTARIEALVTGAVGSPDAQWQGICWYRRTLRLEPAAAGGKVLLRFEGAMNVADVWLDGRRVGGHMGGYLPFVLDISQGVATGSGHVLAVRLDNRDNPITGPKPLAQLDFNTYGGLYRPVYLVRTSPLHITDPILADRPASGGVFVTYPQVSRESATVRAKVHVRNELPAPRTFRLRATLLAADGTVAARATSALVTLPAGTDRDVVQELEVKAPRLWSPSPALADVKETLTEEEITRDTRFFRTPLTHWSSVPGSRSPEYGGRSTVAGVWRRSQRSPFHHTSSGTFRIF